MTKEWYEVRVAGSAGTALGIATRVVEALLGDGSSPQSLRAALGPSIGACCYEVGEAVREAFGARGEGFFRPGPRGRPHLDVPGANRAQLRAAGLVLGAIAHVDECTHCQPGYHSYPARRERGRADDQLRRLPGLVEARGLPVDGLVRERAPVLRTFQNTRLPEVTGTW